MKKFFNQAGNEIEFETQSMESSISLDDVIETSSQRMENSSFPGVYVSELVFDEEHKLFCIHHPYEKDYVVPVLKATVDVSVNDIGREVLVSFHAGSVYQPIITGKVQNLNPFQNENKSTEAAQVNLGMDNPEKIVFDADKEIVLKCGKSSITLTRAGKILIRGEYVLSRSNGVNRIQGGSVQLN